MTAAVRQHVHEDRRTDEQLILEYRQGDQTCFGLLVGRYHRELFHFLARFTGDRTLADDVFQDTFLQVHQSLDGFDTQKRLRPWLFTIAANKARDSLRARKRRHTLPLQGTSGGLDDSFVGFAELIASDDPNPSQPMEKRELQAKVQAAVSTMPEHLKQVLLLSYFHQFPYKQISEMLDVPLGTVKSRLHAAVAHFAVRWRATETSQ